MHSGSMAALSPRRWRLPCHQRHTRSPLEAGPAGQTASPAPADLVDIAPSVPGLAARRTAHCAHRYWDPGSDWPLESH